MSEYIDLDGSFPSGRPFGFLFHCASRDELEDVRAFVDALRAAGWTITASRRTSETFA